MDNLNRFDTIFLFIRYDYDLSMFSAFSTKKNTRVLCVINKKNFSIAIHTILVFFNKLFKLYIFIYIFLFDIYIREVQNYKIFYKIL